MKLITGVFTARPGKRYAYLAAAGDHIERTRSEPGCLFFHLVPSPEHPDIMLLSEGFADAAAHRRHEDTDHMRALWAVGPALLAEVEIYSMVSDEVEHKKEVFS